MSVSMRCFWICLSVLIQHSLSEAKDITLYPEESTYEEIMPEATAKDLSTDSLCVGVLEAMPFSGWSRTHGAKGFAVDAWQALAKKQSIVYHFRPYPSVAIALDDLANARCDVIAGPVIDDATARRRFNWSRAFLQDHYALLGTVPLSQTFIQGLLNLITQLDYRHFLSFVGGLFFVANVLIWTLKKDGVGYFRSIKLIILDLFSWGVNLPVENRQINHRWLIRLVVIIWCLSFQLLMAGVIATFSTALILSNQPSQDSIDRLMRGKRIGYVIGHELPQVIQQHGGIPVGFDSTTALMQALWHKEVSYVSDLQSILKRLQQQGAQSGRKDQLIEMPTMLFSLRYVFSNQLNNKEAINQGLMQVMSDVGLRYQICSSYGFSEQQDCLR